MAFGVPGTEEMKHIDAVVRGDASGAQEAAGHRLVARVGPPPRSTGRPRGAWLAEALHGSAAPLPDGLPGVVGRDRGRLVLPEQCDSGDVPMVVTVRSQGPVPELDSEREVAELLLCPCRTPPGRRRAARGESRHGSLPLCGRRSRGSRGRPTGGGRPSCRVPGMRIEPRHGTLGGFASTVGDRLRTCSLELSDKDGDVTARGQFVMTSHPRLTVLFAGMAGATSPGAGWRGKGRVEDGGGRVTAECRGRPTVFSLQLDEELDQGAEPDSRRVFARSANSVAERLGCPAVGPSG